MEKALWTKKETIDFIKSSLKEDYEKEEKLLKEIEKFESEYHQGVQEGKLQAIRQAIFLVELFQEDL